VNDVDRNARRAGVARLAVVLDAEERLYVELRDLLQRERECMVQLDAEGLEAVVEAKETLLEEAALLEESRLEVVRALVHALGGAIEAPSLSRLCQALGDDAAPLRERHARLVALVAAVGELVELNADVARQGLARVRETLGSLGHLLPPEPVYAPAGVRPGRRAAGRLVESVA